MFILACGVGGVDAVLAVSWLDRVLNLVADNFSWYGSCRWRAIRDSCLAIWKCSREFVGYLRLFLAPDSFNRDKLGDAQDKMGRSSLQILSTMDQVLDGTRCLDY